MWKSYFILAHISMKLQKSLNRVSSYETPISERGNEIGIPLHKNTKISATTGSNLTINTILESLQLAWFAGKIDKSVL